MPTGRKPRPLKLVDNGKNRHTKDTMENRENGIQVNLVILTFLPILTDGLICSIKVIMIMVRLGILHSKKFYGRMVNLT